MNLQEKAVKKPKQIRISSEKIVCHICGREIFKRGWVSHLRIGHPEVSRKQVTASLGGTAEKGWKHKKKKSDPEMTMIQLLTLFGVAWALNEISKHVSKQPITLKSELNKPTPR